MLFLTDYIAGRPGNDEQTFLWNGLLALDTEAIASLLNAFECLFHFRQQLLLVDAHKPLILRLIHVNRHLFPICRVAIGFLWLLSRSRGSLQRLQALL